MPRRRVHPRAVPRAAPAPGIGRPEGRSFPPPRSAVHRRAFTLVEIMIVVAIIGLVLTMGMPSIMQVARKEPLRQAVSDVVEGLSHARAQAILQGTPADLVLRAGDGQLMVQTVHERPATDAAPGALGAPTGVPPAATSQAAFTAHLHPDVAITLLYVNLTDQMQAEEIHVRFYPNGTCDDFAIVLEARGGVQKISLDAITGLPDVEIIR